MRARMPALQLSKSIACVYCATPKGSSDEGEFTTFRRIGRRFLVSAFRGDGDDDGVTLRPDVQSAGDNRNAFSHADISVKTDGFIDDLGNRRETAQRRISCSQLAGDDGHARAKLKFIHAYYVVAGAICGQPDNSSKLIETWIVDGCGR